VCLQLILRKTAAIEVENGLTGVSDANPMPLVAIRWLAALRLCGRERCCSVRLREVVGGDWISRRVRRGSRIDW
jgi:hypothetical protein